MSTDVQDTVGSPESPEVSTHDSLERNGWLPFKVQTLLDGLNTWYVAADVCEVLDITLERLKRMPPSALSKVKDSSGRMVWAVNDDGLLWLLAATALRTQAPRRHTVVMEYLDADGKRAYPPEHLPTVFAQGAQVALMAAIEMYPQKPRQKKQHGTPGDIPQQISEGVSDQP